MALGGLGDAAKGVTDAATKNVAGDTLDALAAGLAGKAGSNAPGTAHFIKADGLAEQAGSGGGAVQNAPVGEDGSTKPENVLSLDPLIEFIHLSYVHPDVVKTFAGPAGSHGIAFRDALLREDILVWSFARSAQRVLEQAKASKGAAGAMLETAGSLLGGAKQASQGPEAIDPVLDKVRSAGDKVNSDSPTYTNVHDAGKDLAQAWADLNTACMSALKPGSGGGLGLPTLPGSNLLGGLGVPAVVAKIPEWLFKAQDCYMAMAREARIAYEWPLMKVVHGYSIAAIQADWRPTYDIWFLRDAPAQPGDGGGPESVPEKKLGDASQALGQQSSPETALQDAQNSLNGLPSYGSFDPGGSTASPLGAAQQAIAGQRGDAQRRVDDAKREIGEQRQDLRNTLGDITGWLATAESEQADVPPEAVAALAACFAVFKGDGQANPPVRPLAEVLGDGLASGLGMSALPGFLKVYLGITCDIALVVLPKLYGHLHGRLGKPDPNLFLAAIHDAIASRIVELVWGLIFGKDSKPGANAQDVHRKRGTDVVDGLGQGHLDPTAALPSMGELENKVADLIKQFLASQARHLDALFLFLAQDLFQELGVAYADAQARKALTMEAYIGHLPRMTALLARNLTFPMFNLILEIFGLGDKFAGMAWNPVKDKLDQAGQIARQAKNTKDDVTKAGERASQIGHQADTAIEDKQRQLGDDRDALASSSSGTPDAVVMQKLGQAGTLADHVGSAPQDIWDAAMRQDAEAAGIVLPQPKGSGPISAERKAAGAAAKVTPGEPVSAGYVDAGDEDAAANAQQTPPPPAPATPGPKLGDLPF